VFDTANDPAPMTVTLVVSVAGFILVGLVWMAAAFGRGGLGLARLRDQNDLGETGDTDTDAS
jgi:hypothetical protein